MNIPSAVPASCSCSVKATRPIVTGASTTQTTSMSFSNRQRTECAPRNRSTTGGDGYSATAGMTMISTDWRADSPSAGRTERNLIIVRDDVYHLLAWCFAVVRVVPIEALPVLRQYILNGTVQEIIVRLFVLGDVGVLKKPAGHVLVRGSLGDDSLKLLRIYADDVA